MILSIKGYRGLRLLVVFSALLNQTIQQILLRYCFSLHIHAVWKEQKLKIKNIKINN